MIRVEDADFASIGRGWVTDVRVTQRIIENHCTRRDPIGNAAEQCTVVRRPQGGQSHRVLLSNDAVDAPGLVVLNVVDEVVLPGYRAQLAFIRNFKKYVV